MTISRPGPLPLDGSGLLPEGAIDAYRDAEAYLVFSQRKDATIDIAAWQRHAAQFYGADLTLTRPKQYGQVPPQTDAAHVVLTPRDRQGVMRTVLLLPRTDEDLACAERAEGGGGLALLAKRCSMVVHVIVASNDDHDALLLAAIVAGIFLGPILTPDRRRLLGARTARLEALEREG